MNVLLFPGQGAQKVGMAADLAAAFPAARDALEAIDQRLGVPLAKLMAEGPESELQLTHNTQPAILAHSAAVLAVVAERLTGSAVVAAGHSLGEYSAYLAAGSLTAPTAAALVRRRGELMYQAGQDRPGAMAAVIGLETAQVEAACRNASDPGVAVAANLNAPDQTVISGDPAAVERAGEGCKAAGAKRVIPLKVSGAFHSPLMEPAVAGLVDALSGAEWAEPGFPVIANVSGQPVQQCLGSPPSPGRPADRPGPVGGEHADCRRTRSGGHLHRDRTRLGVERVAQTHRAGRPLHHAGYRRRSGGLPLMSTPVDLSGQVALVTGSTRGIGLAIARALHAAGASVAVHGRDLSRAQAVAAELGSRAVGVAGDVADGAQVEALVSAAEAALGPITLLVNNAGSRGMGC